MTLEIPGLKEYGTVRKAYDKASILLNTENPDKRELSDLLNVLDNNPRGVELVKAEEREGYDKTYRLLGKKARYPKANELLEVIEKSRIRKKDLCGAMIRTESAALVSLLHKVVGNDSEANELLEEIERYIPVTDVIYSEDECKIEPNADYYILEGRFSANIFVRLLKKEIGDSCNVSFKLQNYPTAFSLGKKPEEKRWCVPYTQALIGIASAVDNHVGYARGITDCCKDALDRSKWLYNNTESLYLNASMSILHKCIGNHKEAGWIIEGIEKNIKKEGGRFKDGSEIWIPGNALMGIAYAMQDGAKLCGLPRD